MYYGLGGRKSIVPTLKDLSSLSFVDLKKIHKAYEAYVAKSKKHNSDCATIEENNYQGLHKLKVSDS